MKFPLPFPFPLDEVESLQTFVAVIVPGASRGAGILGNDTGAGPSSGAILQEDGFFILQEDGSYILLE